MDRFKVIRFLVPAVFICALVAEDMKLRDQAVQLMEAANAVSLPGALKNYEQVVSFRVHEPDGSVKEGSITRTSAGADGHRDEFTFGDYHKVIVISGDKISQTRSTVMFRQKYAKSGSMYRFIWGALISKM